MNGDPVSTTQPEPSTVSAYISQLNRVLSTQRGRIKGEVTTIKPYPWGVIFTIKDKEGNACLDCMIWKREYQANGVELKAGDEVIVTGCPDIFASNGRLSFKAVTIEYAGEGALKRDYEKLKAKLATEGLFSPERKRPLPSLPTRIGVITSMHGVVIQDFTTNLGRHGFKITTVDSRVEGKDAIHELLAALRTIAKQDIEVLVIMRGGGSLEALQAFNNETIVRAIADFKVPVLTGIGHDVDVTLSEMVADIGRSTPTAVAEALNEPWDGLTHKVELWQDRTLGRYRRALVQAAQTISDEKNTVFRAYERRIAQAQTEVSNKSTDVTAIFTRLAQRVREANKVLLTATGIMKANVRAKRRYLEQLPGDLRRYTRSAVATAEDSLDTLFGQVTSSQADIIQANRQSLSESIASIVRVQRTAIQTTKRELPSLERQITAHDPKRRMQQGYSLSYTNGKLVRSTADITAGDMLTTQLADGEFTSEVKGLQ